MKLYIVYNNNLNHIDICKKGYGASEFQFYMLAKKLANHNFDVTVFNQSNINNTIDNITYRKYSDIFNGINIDTSAIVIVMRFFQTALDLLKYFPVNNINIWAHDYLEKYDASISSKINENNIKIIAVSNFHKKNLSRFFNSDNITTIYNILYSDIYKKQDNINIIKDNIVFASAWAKGLDRIISLFDKLYLKYPQFRLVLLKPIYSKCISPKRDYIQLFNTVDNKEEYSRLLQSSLCTITSEFPETFGCVFAESYYLNTPVIATNKINGLHEFINNDHICNLRIYEEFEKILLNIYENRPYVSLDNNLIDDNGINQWINYFRNNYQ